MNAKRSTKINAEYRAAVDRLVASRKRRDSDAQRWLANFLKSQDWSKLENPSLFGYFSEEPRKLSPRQQITVLRLCIEWMVELRHSRGSIAADRQAFRINIDLGGVIYYIANDLFRRPLPFSESDICTILETTHHDCGHGGDVAPPLDLALAHARKHGLSPRLLGALRSYVDRLTHASSSAAQNLKKKASLLFTLEPTDGKKRCWSQTFRDGLSRLPKAQQERWRSMVLHMDAVEYGRNEKKWKAIAPEFVAALGAEQIVACLSAWWPTAARGEACPLETGGSYLLQHFIWLLDVIAQEKVHARSCDALIVRLSKLDWKPKERGQKVMVAATHFLEHRRPTVAWSALQRLNDWSNSVDKKPGHATGHSIEKALHAYARKHRLSAAGKSV